MKHLLLLLCCCLFQVNAQKITKTKAANEYQNIYCGLQDKAGNLWFGATDEGIYRFDGKSFTQFTTQNGLSSNIIVSMLEDKSGNIWIGTDKGLCCYDGNTIKQIPINSNTTVQLYSDSKPPNKVFSIMQDKKGMLWLGTAEGVFCYDGISFSRFLDNPKIKNYSYLTLKNVQCMFEDKNGTVWFGSGPMAFEGLCYYKGETLNKADLINENWIRHITENKNKDLLLTSRHIGTLSFNGYTFSNLSQPKQLQNNLLTYTLEDSKGNMWYASDYVNDNDLKTGGLWKFDGKSFTEFTKKEGLSNTSATFILEDKEGTIWIGTRNTGLYCYNGKTFKSFSE